MNPRSFGTRLRSLHKRKFGLRFTTARLSSFRTVSLNALVQLSAPFGFVHRMKREVPLRCRGAFAQVSGLDWFTEDTASRALGEHSTTLMTRCIHRDFCAADAHSGEGVDLHRISLRRKIRIVQTG